jgi:hypothetical protein
MFIGGPLSLCSLLQISRREVAVVRIQRAVRKSIVMIHLLKAGDRVRAAGKNSGEWMHGIVIQTETNMTVIQVIRERQKSKQYFFMPHPSLRLRRL